MRHLTSLRMVTRVAIAEQRSRKWSPISPLWRRCTSHAIRALQELAAPEKKIVRVRVASVLGSVVETSEEVEQAVERLKEHLLKLLAEDTRIVLE